MLSVLIVNWNTRELLRACLESLRRHPGAMPMESIVVDNASSDGSADMVRSDFPEVRLIASPVNTGYAVGNNLAFEAAIGDFLLALNPDTEILPDTLDQAVNALERHPNAGCLGIRQIAPDGQTQKSVRGFPTLVGILGDILKIRSGTFDSYRMAGFDYGEEQEAPQPMGTFLMFRRRALSAVGDPARPFDEGFPIFFNEVDLLLRLKKAGWPAFYSPTPTVLHHGGESTKQVRKSMIWESHRSLVRFLRKHGGTANAKIGLFFLAPVIYLAAFVRAKGYHAGFRA
jgi:N-acetylglucosaminyl-diphospho-decaprenol L-rhamnosyltransferase